jgi:hypothetical protein
MARAGTLSQGACPSTSALGSCSVPQQTGNSLLLTALGTDSTTCFKVAKGCTNIDGGDFTPLGPCVAALAGGGPPNFDPIPPWVQVCRAPLPGEPPGKSAGGQVCTHQSISGATEEGRNFKDYASCDVVRPQRGYYPVPPSKHVNDVDPRLGDPAYVKEMMWARAQANSTGCSCCHRASVTPSGPAVWDTDSGGNWANSFSAYGLAFAAGVIDSHLLGAYAAADNNGFARDLGTSRDLPGLASTDPARMKNFFLGELAHRGIPLSRFSVEGPTPGFAAQLAAFVPPRCGPQSGVGPDGTILWGGPPSRYVQVLQAGSPNPGIQPNLDLPPGTLWRLDAPVTGAGFAPGSVKYGVVPAGASQGFPAAGTPPALVKGKTYYLYVQIDIPVPVERCVFTF